MLNPRLDRSPVSRTSGLLVVLAWIALTTTIAGLSITAAGLSPAESPRLAALAPPTVEAPQPGAQAAAAPQPAAPAQMDVPSPLADRVRRAENAQQAAASAAFVISVTDQFGRPVPNASVTVAKAGVLPQLAGGTTDQGGQFTASGLTDGVYDLSVAKPGFSKARMTLPLAAGKTIEPGIVLGLGSLQETVVVTAAAGTRSSGAALPAARHVDATPPSDPCVESQEGGCVMPPIKLVDVKPVYPASYVEAGASGTVVIQARVLADGTVGDLQPEPGSDADLAAAAMQAIRLWQFSPTHLDGVPVPVRMTVTVRFEISKS